jgi:phenylalanine-4-hydroxylase
MFEEAQLYAPVTEGPDGVQVHLADDHPGAHDPEYRARRNDIAAAALRWREGEPVPRVDYSEAEQEIWRTVCRELAPKHERLACRAFRDAKAALDLPTERVPQLDEVTAGLQRLTGWSLHPAAGLVPLDEFYGALADRVFHSTQYLRHPSAPLYTPEPDIVHEVIGHGNLLADPQVAAVKQLAGQAARRCETPEGLQYLADVFWFTIEFGVMWEEGELRCYGAGLLSSYGEIEEFRGAEIRPVDFHAMATLEYDITHYQPILFAVDGMGELTESVGGFFADFDDDTPARLAAAARGGSRFLSGSSSPTSSVG